MDVARFMFTVAGRSCFIIGKRVHNQRFDQVNIFYFWCSFLLTDTIERGCFVPPQSIFGIERLARPLDCG